MQRPDLNPPWKWTTRNRLRGSVLVVILLLTAPAAVSAVTEDPMALQRGTITSPANGTTVISVQGFKIAGRHSGKKPARLVGVGPRGSVKWVYRGGPDIVWFYDVDPLANGTLLITGTKPGKTVVRVWDPQTRETVWSRTFDWTDTHDVDLINGDQLLVANMRQYNETTGENNARLLVYDRSKDTIVWQWRFRNHGYAPGRGGPYKADWTHVNDVDKVGPGRYLGSVKNFDQVVVVDRTTGETAMQLGTNQNHSRLYKQHNPQFLRGANGTPTMLVADSGNDRVVEYARRDGHWTRTWRLGGTFSWPRDADRLPDGNTLVTDTHNQRVMEVTPSGEVVWEFYAPWAPYEAERIRFGDEAGGPTIGEQNATGTATLHGSAALTPGVSGTATFPEWLRDTFAGTPLATEVTWFANRWEHVTPWIRPVWMGSWDFVAVALAGVLALGWLVAEGVVHRAIVYERVAAVLRWGRG